MKSKNAVTPASITVIGNLIHQAMIGREVSLNIDIKIQFTDTQLWFYRKNIVNLIKKWIQVLNITITFSISYNKVLDLTSSTTQVSEWFSVNLEMIDWSHSCSLILPARVVALHCTSSPASSSSSSTSSLCSKTHGSVCNEKPLLDFAAAKLMSFIELNVDFVRTQQ